MLISYKWLQSYFDEKLPLSETLAERITFGFAEVESIKSLEASDFADKRGLTETRINADKKGGDTIFDVKVLPDRACYALSHRGVAYEVAAITGLKKKTVEYPQPEVKKTRALIVRVEAPELCSRYMARVVENVTQREMPWVKEHLEAVGQRSINPVVDGANLVMFDMGQPLHAFDADKVRGGITVRRARKGEKLTTLDNRETALDESVLIIADEESPLAIAGIKGGTKAAVTTATKNLILEAANFNPSYIRKTAERLGIKTDASKRFENKLSPEMASVGMNDFTAFLFESDKAATFGEITDVYSDSPRRIRITVTADCISKKLGLKVSEYTIINILRRLEIVVEKKGVELILTPPTFRADLTIPEDIAEEIGRIIGYDKIPAILPPKFGKAIEIPKAFYYEWKVREALVNAGFSEVMTSSFVKKGEMAIEKPLAEDKGYLRKDLCEEIKWNCLEFNSRSADLLGVDSIKVFEIGTIFKRFGEHVSLAIGADLVGKEKELDAMEIVRETVRKISSDFRVYLDAHIRGNNLTAWVEVNLDAIFAKLPEPKKWDISIPPTTSDKFTAFSPYPFIVRDVALFVSPETTPESVGKIIKENAGDLVVRGPELFDEFSKDGKKSLAFRLVFQSFDRTLSDEEVNTMTERVYAMLKGKGWEVR